MLLEDKKRILKDLRKRWQMTKSAELIEFGEEIEHDLDKLNQLANIENELGVDLITLFKALKNGICVKDYPEIKTVSLTLFFDGNRELWFQWLGNKRPYPTFYKVSDYGKTWVLDKKELENDK